MAFHLDDDYRLVNEVPSCSSPSSPSPSSSPISPNQFLSNDGSSSIFLLSPSPHKKPNLNTISPIKEPPVYYLTQGSPFNGLDGSRISNLQLLAPTKSSQVIDGPSVDTIIDTEANLSEMIELNVANFSEINGSPLGDSVSTLDVTSSGDCSPVIGIDGGGGDGSDVYQAAQVKLIQIPSNANVIQVPSNLLVTSNDNLILCLPPEGITFQVQSNSLDSTTSSMETSAHELYNSSNCNQLSTPSSLTTLTPITFPDLIQKSNAFDGDSIEIQSPEIQLEKAQTWHKDSQLAIVALAALKATNKLNQIEMQ